MESSITDLSLDCLIHVLSFLNEDDLTRVSGVSKSWLEASETPWLWRKMCLRRWSFCNIGQSVSGDGQCTWKSYYLHRSRLEDRMKTGRSSVDYTCSTLRGHTGRIVSVVYLVENSHLSGSWNSSPVVCSASSDGTVRAWSVQQGVQLWASPAQSPLSDITADLGQGVVFTSGTTGVIQAWDGQMGRELASFSTASDECKLLAFSIDGRPLLIAGTGGGALYCLTSLSLSQLSRQVVFDAFSVNQLIASPDRNWILAATTESFDASPKVFSCRDLEAPTDDEPPLCQTVPISGCLATAFLPSEPARLAVVHASSFSHAKSLSIFDVVVKKSKYKTEVTVQQLESFQLEANWLQSDVLLRAQGSSTLLVAMGNSLKVYTLKGSLLATFADHTQPIAALWVDTFRVVTASHDLSLRVLTWKNDKEGGQTLESQYHLLGGSHTMSRGFTNVACDYASIVASVESINGKDVLKAYSFSS